MVSVLHGANLSYLVHAIIYALWENRCKMGLKHRIPLVLVPNGLAGPAQSESVQVRRLLPYFETGTKAANEMLQCH